MKNFTKIIMLAIAFVILAGSAQAQTSVDLELRISPPVSTYSVTLGSGQDISFPLYVDKNNKSQASGVIVTVEIPEDVTVSSAKTDRGECSYSGNLITCNLGIIEAGSTLDYRAFINISVKPTVVGTVILRAQIKGNEPDPNLSNNTATLTVTVNPPKSRKRVRFF